MRESNKLMGVIFLVLLFLISTILAIPIQSIGTEDNNNSMFGTITGIVIDEETDEPINYTLMTLQYHDETHYTVTDSNGLYAFYKVPICFCLKNVSAEKTGYQSQFKYIPVDKVTYVNFSLKSINDTNKDDPEKPEEPDNNEFIYGSIMGIVVDDKTTKPIRMCKMTLKYHDEFQVKYTDSEGSYTFEKVPMCFCLKNVSAQKDGYREEYELVAVSQVTYVNFSLTPEDSSPDQNDPSDETEDPEDPDNSEIHKGVIKGIVIDAVTENPINDAYIVLEYHEIIRNTYSDSNGEYSFSDVPVCNCSKDITSEKDGYKTQHLQIGVYRVTYVNFSLEPIKESEDSNGPNNGMYGTIYGTVMDVDSKVPIKEVIVKLKYHDKIRNTKTNSKGEFKFTNVPICYCLKNITVMKENYKTQTKLIPVNESTTVYFLIEKSNDNILPPQDLPPKSDDKSGKYTEEHLYGNLNGLGVIVIGIISGIIILIITSGLIFVLNRKNMKK